MPKHWYWKRRKVNPQYQSMTAMTVTVPSFNPYSASNPPYPQEIKDLGLAIEPIVGKRTFQLSTGESIGLHSLNGEYWAPYEPLVAYCNGNPLADHDVPLASCSCGIYAWNSDMPVEDAPLWGEVYLWGDVLVCQTGYRAEMAYPKSLHINAALTRSAIRIRDTLEAEYGVPVTLTDPLKPDVPEPDVPIFGTGPTGPAFPTYPTFTAPRGVPGYIYPTLPPPTPPSGTAG